MAAKRTQKSRVALVTSALSGVQKYLATLPSLILATTTYTPAQLQSLLQAYLTAVAALQILHTQLHTAVTGTEAQATQIDEILSALESFVVNMFGARSDQVTAFGFTPRKVAVLTAAEKAASRAKAAATRKAKKDALASVTSSATPSATQTASNGVTAKA
jgi:hypothetical protein